MEFGTPRGKETTIGSWSGLFGETLTVIEVVQRIFFLDDDVCFVDGGVSAEVAATLSALRFFVEPTIFALALRRY